MFITLLQKPFKSLTNPFNLFSMISCMFVEVKLISLNGIYIWCCQNLIICSSILKCIQGQTIKWVLMLIVKSLYLPDFPLSFQVNWRGRSHESRRVSFSVRLQTVKLNKKFLWTNKLIAIFTHDYDCEHITIFFLSYCLC